MTRGSRSGLQLAHWPPQPTSAAGTRPEAALHPIPPGRHAHAGCGQQQSPHPAPIALAGLGAGAGHYAWRPTAQQA